MKKITSIVGSESWFWLIAQRNFSVFIVQK